MGCKKLRLTQAATPYVARRIPDLKKQQDASGGGAPSLAGLPLNAMGVKPDVELTDPTPGYDPTMAIALACKIRSDDTSGVPQQAAIATKTSGKAIRGAQCRLVI